MKPGSHGESSAKKKLGCLFLGPRFVSVAKKKWLGGPEKF